MKLEELTQDRLDELLASVEALTESQKGLKADLAKAKAKAKGAEIDPEEHANLQTQVADLTERLAKAEKSGKGEVEKLTKQLQEKDSALTTYLVDSQLTDSLAKAGVLPQFMDATKALLKSQATIKADNGQYQALIGDKPIAEAIKEWASSDNGKHYVKAPDNGGGGANGGEGGGAGGIKPKADGTEKERAAYVKDKYKLPS